MRPNPSRPKDASDQRLASSGWDIDKQIANVALEDGFEMLTNHLDMPVVLEDIAGFDHVPGVLYEQHQAAFVPTGHSRQKLLFRW